MSKRRSRYIRPFQLEKLSLFKTPLVSPLDSDGNFFGEKIEKVNPQVSTTTSTRTLTSLSSDDSLENLFANFCDVGYSSSSSLSWGSEYFNETTKRVREELERMDRVLRGLEPIPDNYDKEEYQEWMEFFPKLSILEHASESIIKDQNTDNYSKRIKRNSSVDNIKSKVELPERFSNKSNDRKFINRLDNNINIDIDNYLKVSHFNCGREPIIRRQPSSRSLISSQISSSKWLKEEESEFDSLPFLIDPYRAKSVLTNNKLRPPKGILKNTLVLPPIENKQVRSVSAVPASVSKSLSALAVNNGHARTRLETPLLHSRRSHKK